MAAPRAACPLQTRTLAGGRELQTGAQFGALLDRTLGVELDGQGGPADDVRAQRAKSSMVLSTPCDESLRGRNGFIGALIADALTENGW